MDPHEANAELVRGHGELVPLCEAQGRVALEGRFRIRLEFFVNSREKDGLKQRLSISLPLKKASICFRASHLKFRGLSGRYGRWKEDGVWVCAEERIRENQVVDCDYF